MVAIVQTGNHFTNPWLMSAHTVAAASINFADTTGTFRTSATAAFFTAYAGNGVQDQTNWTANTYKTIYSHTGTGIIYGMIACTAGGAETTTFEITIDGVLSTITVTNANGERAFLSAAGVLLGTEYTTADLIAVNPYALDSGTLTTYQTGGLDLPGPKLMQNLGVPALRYNVSALVRMKHSAIITNSTATAYSGVLVRKGIAA